MYPLFRVGYIYLSLDLIEDTGLPLLPSGALYLLAQALEVCVHFQVSSVELLLGGGSRGGCDGTVAPCFWTGPHYRSLQGCFKVPEASENTLLPSPSCSKKHHVHGPPPPLPFPSVLRSEKHQNHSCLLHRAGLSWEWGQQQQGWTGFPFPVL